MDRAFKGAEKAAPILAVKTPGSRELPVVFEDI
jgi:hypothetical protein